MFLSKKQTVKEISFSGVLDTQVAPLFDSVLGFPEASVIGSTSNLFGELQTLILQEIFYMELPV